MLFELAYVESSSRETELAYSSRRSRMLPGILHRYKPRTCSAA
jgi:hypothetical protein